MKLRFVWFDEGNAMGIFRLTTFEPKGAALVKCPIHSPVYQVDRNRKLIAEP